MLCSFTDRRSDLPLESLLASSWVPNISISQEQQSLSTKFRILPDEGRRSSSHPIVNPERLPHIGLATCQAREIRATRHIYSKSLKQSDRKIEREYCGRNVGRVSIFEWVTRRCEVHRNALTELGELKTSSTTLLIRRAFILGHAERSGARAVKIQDAHTVVERLKFK